MVIAPAPILPQKKTPALQGKMRRKSTAGSPPPLLTLFQDTLDFSQGWESFAPHTEPFRYSKKHI